MGKNLIIKGADFSKNSIEGNGYSGTLYMENGGINISAPNLYAFCRMIAYDDGQVQKRVRMYLDEQRHHIYVPKGFKLKLNGVQGLCLDYAIYNQEHDPNDFKLLGVGHTNQYGVDTASYDNNTKPLHPYKVGTYTEGVKPYFTLTDGVVDTVTIPADNTNDRYFALVAKNPDNTAINVGEFEITFEVFE